MKKMIDIYNPYDNQSVTRYYVQIVEKALQKSGYETNIVSTLENTERHESIFVVYPYDALRAHKHGYKEVLLWIQGISPEESYMRNKSKIRYAFLSLRERLGLKYADKIIMVSHEMSAHYKRKYRLDLDVKSFFMPCFNSEIDLNSFFTPSKYEKQVFVYAGALAVWQCFEQTVQLYKCIEDELQDTRLEIYTAQREEAAKIAKKYGIKNYVIDFLTPEELSKRLKKAKYGFVLREDNEINRVATPTKISSYTADGVIPIYSSCLSDFHSKVNGKKSFISVSDDICESANVQKILCHCKSYTEANQVKADFMELFREYYNSDYYVSSLANFLSKPNR